MAPRTFLEDLCLALQISHFLSTLCREFLPKSLGILVSRSPYPFLDKCRTLSSHSLWISDLFSFKDCVLFSYATQAFKSFSFATQGLDFQPINTTLCRTIQTPPSTIFSLHHSPKHPSCAVSLQRRRKETLGAVHAIQGAWIVGAFLGVFYLYVNV